ncbi:MAG TPA: recombination protein O N-terminal domain-containing protein [Verrucomicrobiae bacterium]|nr:recombination protein O N-terminal domain-containing protein [Verrucomicrobiae bacterium]
MPYLRDTVYVLRTEPFREHDAWISMYGREHGKLEAVARGFRNAKAKQHGHLEPLTKTEVMIAVGASVDKLAVAHAVSAQTDLRGRLGAMAMMGSFAHLLDSLTKPGVADPEVFDLMDELSAAWRATTREPSTERARLLYAAAALRLLNALGYAPELERADVGDEAAKLLAMLPQLPLSFALSVSAPASVFQAVCATVEEALEDAPLRERPHGPDTIAKLLT